MPKKATPKKHNFSNRLRNIGRANLALAAAFVLVFAGVGTWYIQRSEAATVCAKQQFQQGSYGTCVKYIQGMINAYGSGPYHLTVDGSFGPQTYRDVVRFQYQMGISGGNGVVGSRTWVQLCGASSIVGIGDADVNDFTNAGCRYVWSPNF